MRIGIACNIYSDTYSYYGDMWYQKVKEFGFDCVDFGIGHTDTPIYTLPIKEADGILLKQKALAAEAEIDIWQTHGPWCWPPPETTEDGMKVRMAQMKRSIRAASVLGCKSWVIHPIMPYMAEEAGTDKEELTWQANLVFMRELLKSAKEYGVTICLENMPMTSFSIATPEKILKFVKEIDDDNFKICLDTGHVAVFDGLSLAEETRRLGKEIRVLHVHDNEVGQDVHQLPFYGRIEWDEFAKALRDIGFDGVFSMELGVPFKYPVNLREDMFRFLAQTANFLIN